MGLLDNAGYDAAVSWDTRTPRVLSRRRLHAGTDEQSLCTRGNQRVLPGTSRVLAASSAGASSFPGKKFMDVQRSNFLRRDP